MSGAQKHASPGASAPNYGKIGALSVAGGAIGAGVGFALKLGAIGTGVAGGGGFLAVLGVMMGYQAVGDTKRLTTANSVRKLTEKAWNAQTLGRLDQAEKNLKEALGQTGLLGPKNVLTLSTIHSMANLNRLQKKYDESEKMYTRAISIYSSLGKNQDPNLASCYRDRALTLEALDKLRPALESAAQAASIFEHLGSRDELWQTYSLMARCHLSLQERVDAIRLLTQVKSTQISVLGENSREVVATTLSLARAHREEQQLNEAFDQYKELLTRLRKVDRPNRKYEAEGLLEMAEIRLLQRQPKDVEPLAITAIKVLQNHVGPRQDLLKRIFVAYQESRIALNLAIKDTDLLQLFSFDRDKVRDLLKEHPELTSQKDKTGWCSLQWACFLGYDDLIRWLLRNGGAYDNYDPATTMGAIHVAAAWGKTGSVVAIIEAGADIDSRGPGGWTPLFYATQSGKTDIVEQLLARGAELAAKDQQGRLPVLLAAENGHLEIVQIMLARGVDKDTKDDKTGRTLLHIAAANGQGSLVGFLLNNQATLDAKDENGKTPVDLARDAGHKMLVKAMEHSVEPTTSKFSPSA
jgi:ankyrin repeat protein